jgi:hypothetical protein
VIIIEEIMATRAFLREDVIEMFNGVFRKLSFDRTEFWHVSADDLTEAFNEQIRYNLNGMLIEIAEALIE